MNYFDKLFGSEANRDNIEKFLMQPVLTNVFKDYLNEYLLGYVIRVFD